MKKTSVKNSLLIFSLILFPLFVCGQEIVSLSNEKKPYTNFPKEMGNTYRYIVIGDLTGGEESGVFEYAVQRINELSPDFVISVGDLIGGYTKDRSLIEQQWKAFNDAIAKLEMPFFYVPGNHDVGNTILQQVWDGMYGTGFYTFNINKDLFVVLNTFEPHINGISDKQTRLIKEAILKHPRQERIFVFSHDPLWTQFEKPGLNDLALLLQKRNVIYFCGHEHRYLHKKHLGQDHYMLAGIATGNPGMRGIDVGEFHNLMYVTVTPSKTKVSNIQLEGLIPLSIVNNSTEKQVDMALENNWVKIIPTVVESESGKIFKSIIQLKNTGDYPFEIKGAFESVKNGKFSPEHIEYTLSANEEKSIPISLTLQEDINIEDLQEIRVKLNGKFNQPNTNITSSISKIWTIDNLKTCKDISTNSFKMCDRFGEIEESWDWHGLSDGNIEYKVGHDKKYIHISVKTTDDLLLINESDKDALQDKISILFNSDTTFKSTNYAKFNFIANHKATFDDKSKLTIKGFEGRCTIEGNSLIANLKIPRKEIKGNSFRLNFSFFDLDDKAELEPAILWWKPCWNKSEDYPQSGVFIVE